MGDRAGGIRVPGVCDQPDVGGPVPERHSTSGAKSDAGDAWLLAGLVRTDAARHRLARYARNGRLADAIHRWALCSLSASPGARAYHDELRARGKSHNIALRQLGNRLVGILHGCLEPGTRYGEHTAWRHRYGSPEPSAA